MTKCNQRQTKTNENLLTNWCACKNAFNLLKMCIFSIKTVNEIEGNWSEHSCAKRIIAEIAFLINFPCWMQNQAALKFIQSNKFVLFRRHFIHTVFPLYSQKPNFRPDCGIITNSTSYSQVFLNLHPVALFFYALCNPCHTVYFECTKITRIKQPKKEKNTSCTEKKGCKELKIYFITFRQILSRKSLTSLQLLRYCEKWIKYFSFAAFAELQLEKT